MDNPASNPPSATLSSEEEIIVSLRRIIRAVDLHSRKLMEHSGLTGPQLAALQKIDRHQGPVSASNLARAIHLSQGTVTGILSRLEARGLIIRERSDLDRRTAVIRITPTG